MGTAERREREREMVRTAIIEAARDILSEDGLPALSMRAIADRIEYSPATIYLYFRDKDELIRAVVHVAFDVMNEYVLREVAALGETADALTKYGAMGRGYARFAIEHTAYFRAMFELPAVPHEECPAQEAPVGLDAVAQTVQNAADAGLIEIQDARRTAILGWGLVHGLTSLYLTGRLTELVSGNEEFMALVEDAMVTMNVGMRPVAGRLDGSAAI
jgi:AcrR family transcriptional regulator